MIRVGIIGSGTMAEVHAENFSRFPDVKINMVCSVHTESASRIAAKYGARSYDVADRPFERDEVDVLVICTPTPTHAEYALRALSIGKHVFLEKPMARTLQDAQLLKHASETSKGVFMVGHVVRFVQEYVAAKRILEEGRIGTVGVVRTARRARFPIGIADWYADPDQSGGVILDMMIHDIDYLRWCLGEVKEVYARNLLQKRVHHNDFGLVMIRFRNGAIAHLEGSWSFEGEFHYALEVAGREGLISFNSLEASPLNVYLRHSSNKQVRVAVPRNPLKESPYYLEVQHFLECVKTCTQPSVGAQEGYEALRIALAAIESATTGQPVQL